jgi:transposase
MARKHKASRLQYGLFATPFEDLIASDNPVRVIDAFVDAMDLAKAGFYGVQDSHMGAASYDPADLLKLYFYGYYNRIRSSRMLERECARNVELMWLLGQQKPCFRTIAGFRTYQHKDKEGKITHDHQKALKLIFRQFNAFLKGKDMFGLKTFAVDGTKIAAQNSRKNHVTEEKIARRFERTEVHLTAYLEELDLADMTEDEHGNLPAMTQEIINAILDLEDRKEQIMLQDDRLLAARAEDPHVTQIALTDPDARMLPINNEGMTQVAYNVQSVVDSKHNLIAEYEVDNKKDHYMLAQMGQSVKENLQIEGPIELLADKGYHSAKGIHECVEMKIIPYVAFPEQAYCNRPRGFQKEDFVYQERTNTYICPNKEQLHTSGTWHEKRGRQGQVQARYQLFRMPYKICSACPFKEQCLSDSKQRQSHGRTIERSEYEVAMQENKNRVMLNRQKYKRRAAMVEHPFGTTKRSWGYYYTLLRTKPKVSGEMGLVFTTYNLRRAVTLFGVEGLIEALKGHKPPRNGNSGPKHPKTPSYFAIWGIGSKLQQLRA